MNHLRFVLLYISLALVRIDSIAQVTDSAATFHVFSQVADGRVSDGSYFRSTLMVANPSDNSAATCTFRLYGLRASFNTGSITGTATDTFRFTLNKNDWDIASSQGVQNLATGYSTLSCDRPVTAQILYSWYSSNSVKLSEATVFSSPPGKMVQLLADHREGGRLGIALANDTDRSVTYVIAAGDVNGNVAGTSTLTIAARSSSARFIDELISGLRADHMGQVIIASGDQSNVYAIGLKFTGTAFTTIPVTVRSISVIAPPAGVPTLTAITPASGTAGTAVNVTLTGTNFVNGATTVRVSGTGISAGSAQVSGTTSLAVAFTIDATATAGNRSVTVLTSGGTSNALDFSVIATSKPFNQTQTERLIGTWMLSYTIASTFTNTYRLNDVRASTVAAGEWNIFGTDENGDLVLAAYSPTLGQFFLYDPGTTNDKFHTFNFTGTNTVSGCTYQISPPGSTNLGSCYGMTGVRTSLSALTSLSKSDSASESEMVAEAEARTLPNDERGSNDPNVIRVLDGIRRDHQRNAGAIR